MKGYYNRDFLLKLRWFRLKVIAPSFSLSVAKEEEIIAPLFLSFDKPRSVGKATVVHFCRLLGVSEFCR